MVSEKSLDKELTETINTTLSGAIENAEHFLETEKQQIINARIDGVAKSLNMDPEIVDRNASALYYEQTYLTNKETLK